MSIIINLNQREQCLDALSRTTMLLMIPPHNSQMLNDSTNLRRGPRLNWAIRHQICKDNKTDGNVGEELDDDKWDEEPWYDEDEEDDVWKDE